MKLNDTSSNLLRFESFVAACCVVMIHANTIHVVAQPAAWNVAMHAFICQTLTSWAVPYFFAASGFFFALSSFDWSWGGVLAIPSEEGQRAAYTIRPLELGCNFYCHASGVCQ